MQQGLFCSTCAGYDFDNAIYSTGPCFGFYDFTTPLIIQMICNNNEQFRVQLWVANWIGSEKTFPSKENSCCFEGGG